MVSVKGKGRARLCQVCFKETKTIEPLKKYRKRIGVIKTEGESLTQDKFGGNLFYCPFGDRYKGGVNLT